MLTEKKFLHIFGRKFVDALSLLWKFVNIILCQSLSNCKLSITCSAAGTAEQGGGGHCPPIFRWIITNYRIKSSLRGIAPVLSCPPPIFKQAPRSLSRSKDVFVVALHALSIGCFTRSLFRLRCFVIIT